jgi:hypothetical protein
MLDRQELYHLNDALALFCLSYFSGHVLCSLPGGDIEL